MQQNAVAQEAVEVIEVAPTKQPLEAVQEVEVVQPPGEATKGATEIVKVKVKVVEDPLEQAEVAIVEDPPEVEVKGEVAAGVAV
jgi:hypothetical protein